MFRDKRIACGYQRIRKNGARPVTLALEHLAPDRPALVFLAAALGIVPLAGFIVQSTEQIAHRTGDAVGGTSPKCSEGAL